MKTFKMWNPEIVINHTNLDGETCTGEQLTDWEERNSTAVSTLIAVNDSDQLNHIWNLVNNETNCGLRYWEVESKEEKALRELKKIIDLEPLIASGIDCEFSDDGKWQIIGPLDSTNGVLSDNFPYKRKGAEDVAWKQCRPRMNHKMFHDGGECPLPEGFEVELSWRCGMDSITSEYTDLRWDNTGRQADIIGYKILEIIEGYSYSWEKVSPTAKVIKLTEEV